MSIRKLSTACASLLMAGLVIVAAPAGAQSGDNDVLRRTQMQLRQSEQERNSLRGEVARLQSELDGQVAELGKLRQQVTQVQGKQSSSAAELSARAGKLSQVSQALKDSQDELAQLRALSVRQTQAVENMKSMLLGAQQTVALRDELVELCRARNQQLFNVGTEILKMYGDKDFNSFTSREPVLQLKQVKLQNLQQDFEDRLRKERVYKETLPPSLEKSMQENMHKDAAGKPTPPSG